MHPNLPGQETQMGTSAAQGLCSPEDSESGNES